MILPSSTSPTTLTVVLELVSQTDTARARPLIPCSGECLPCNALVDVNTSTSASLPTQGRAYHSQIQGRAYRSQLQGRAYRGQVQGRAQTVAKVVAKVAKYNVVHTVAQYKVVNRLQE